MSFVLNVSILWHLCLHVWGQNISHTTRPTMQKGLTSIISHTVYDDTNTSGVCAKFVELQLILEYRGAIKAS